MKKIKLIDYLKDCDEDDIEISQWFKKKGETFTAKEPVLEVLVGKTETEVSFGKNGTLLEILCDEGEIVSVNDVIAKIE